MSSSALGDWTSQLRRGVLELCILRLLSAEPNYGYEIVTTLDRFTPLAAGENTVYPLLRRLKTDGLLETFMQDSPTGPPRQYYRVTRQGRGSRSGGADDELATIHLIPPPCRSTERPPRRAWRPRPRRF